MPPGELTMTKVADRLGVSAGTLYQYVADRDELVRLVVAARLKALPVPADVGQSWAEYLRDFVDDLTAALSKDTAALIQTLGIESTLEPELRLTEAFYEALTVRGFSLTEAISIHAQVSVIAMGTAMAVSRERLSAGGSGDPARVLDGSGGDLPLIRQAAAAWEGRSVGVHRVLTEALIEHIARSRGETTRE
jgi:AcrR family transcriptional regulator